LKQAVGTGRGDKMPSFYIDLHSSRPKSEVDYLNGAVVRAGIKTNTPTPANYFLNTTLQSLVDKQKPMDYYHNSPEKFVHDFGNIKLNVQS
jgi:2-dehydropantoate 2-reductase